MSTSAYVFPVYPPAQKVEKVAVWLAAKKREREASGSGRSDTDTEPLSKEPPNMAQAWQRQTALGGASKATADEEIVAMMQKLQPAGQCTAERFADALATAMAEVQHQETATLSETLIQDGKLDSSGQPLFISLQVDDNARLCGIGSYGKVYAGLQHVCNPISGEKSAVRDVAVKARSTLLQRSVPGMLCVNDMFVNDTSALAASQSLPPNFFCFEHHGPLLS